MVNFKSIKIQKWIGNSELRKEVAKTLFENEDPIETMKEVCNYGCSSGIIGEMIYYEDTLKFYENHKIEIGKLLQESISDCGLPCDKLFGDKWDQEDPLALDTSNQNLLAWFAFEETTRNLLEQGLSIWL